MWHLFLKREIMAMCFSPAISKDQLAYLQILIEGHHKEFCRIYPACSIIPKMHYMIHMPSVMLKWVSLILILCIYTGGSSQCTDWTKVDFDWFSHHIQHKYIQYNATVNTDSISDIPIIMSLWRLGPLVRSWRMRYEAKHHYFKKLATVIGNDTNLPLTLSTQHQQWICYQLHSTGRNESTFLDGGVEIGPGEK